LKDARVSVTVTLTQENLRDGKKDKPSACAIALAIKDNRGDVFPNLLSAYVRKTHTLVALGGKRIRAFRYSNPEPIRRKINTFDKTVKPRDGYVPELKPGDTVTLLAPAGSRRLGKGYTGSGSGDPLKTRVGLHCTRRGVYVDPIHGRAAADQLGKENVLL
jgi:hypothetical protein